MKKAKGIFKAANIILILTGILHLVGHFQEQAPANEKESTLLDLMKNYYFNFGGMERSMRDIVNALSLSLSLFTFFIALLNLMLLHQLVNQQVLKKIMLINIVFWGVLEIILIRYTIPPPIICYGLAWLCLLVSYLVLSKQTQSESSSKNL